MFSRFFRECFTSIRSSRKVRESETVTKGGSRKGIPLNEGEVGVRKEERRTIGGTSLRLSLGFSGFGFLWVRFLVFRVSLGTSVKSSSASHISCIPVKSLDATKTCMLNIFNLTIICTAEREREREREGEREREKTKEKEQ